MKRKEEKLGEILIKKGKINARDLADALAEQEKTNEFLGAILVKRARIRERDLLEALSEQFGIPVVSLKYRYIDWEFVRKFNSSIVFDHKCMPISEDDWSVTVATANPLDAWALHEAERAVGFRSVTFVLAPGRDIEDAIARYKEYIKGTFSR